MARIPLTAVVGISMISFACFIIFASVKYQKAVSSSHEVGELSEVFAFILGLCCALVGIFVHLANLDTDAAAMSFAVAFLGANVSSLYVFFRVEPVQWLDWSPLMILTTVVGLILGLLIYDGDPQAEVKRTADLENEVKKRLAEAEEARVKWEKLVDEQKLKAESTEKKA